MRIIHLVLGLFILCSAWGQRLIPVGSGLSSGNIWCSTVYDGKVVIGGTFTEFNGQPCNRLIGWDGANDYETFPGFFTDSLLLPRALIEFQGDLVATGNMNGGTRIMRWDGSDWSSMGGIFTGSVLELAVHNGQLIAGGSFTANDGAPLKRIAFWDGTAWISLGGGLDDQVQALVVHNDTLFAGGRFRNSGDGSTDLERIAYWNGVDWYPVSSGLNGSVTDLMSTPNGLWIAGGFTSDMDGTVAGSGACAHNGTAFSSFPLPPLDNEATLFHSVQFGYGISDGSSSWFCDGSNFHRTGCWEIERVVSLNGVDYGEGGLLSASGSVRWDIGRLVSGSVVANTEVAGVSFGLIPNNGFYLDMWSGKPNYTIPANSGAAAIQFMSLSATGSSGGNIYATPPYYSDQVTNRFWPGPVCNDTIESYLNRYLQIWEIDKGMIWEHISHWSDPGYVIPYEIQNWPSHGDTQNGEPSNLSPFNDLDGDGSYEPLLGETPMIRGDKEVHFILSNRYPEIGWPEPTRLDIGVNAYAFHSAPGDTLWHTSFLNLRSINRSSQFYDTLMLGLFTDLDLGCANDDLIGCDTILNMGFSFNGVDFDPDCNGLPGHGARTPSFGIVSLNAEMFAFSMMLDGPGWNGIPEDGPALHNRLLGRWNDGSPMRVSCSNDPSAPVTRYMFATGVSDSTGYSENGCNNAPGYRRFISSYGPFLNVAPGDTICLEFALIFAQDTLGDNFTSVSLLKQKAAAVKAWYDQSGLSCTQDVALGMPTTARPLGSVLSIAPNPAADQVRITLGATAGGELRVLTPTGQLVRSQRYAAHTTALELDLAGLPNGTYLLQTVEPKEIRCGRLVVLH